MIDTAVSLLKAVIRKDYREQHRLALVLADDALSNGQRQADKERSWDLAPSVAAEDASEEARR